MDPIRFVLCMMLITLVGSLLAMERDRRTNIDKDRRECRMAGGRPTGTGTGRDDWYCAKTPDVQPIGSGGAR